MCCDSGDLSGGNLHMVRDTVSCARTCKEAFDLEHFDGYKNNPDSLQVLAQPQSWAAGWCYVIQRGLLPKWKIITE